MLQPWPGRRAVPCFRDAPLADVIAEANRHAEHPIRLADPSLGRAHVTASFTAADTPAIALTLAVSLRLHVTDDGRVFRLGRGPSTTGDGVGRPWPR